MLVLSRFENETIVIDGCIEITVLKICKLNGKRQMSFGITAPRSISVHRKEIQEAINKESNLAVGLTSES